MLFNEIHYRNDKNLLDFNNSNIILRNAVRAIILEVFIRAYIFRIIIANHELIIYSYNFIQAAVHKP